MFSGGQRLSVVPGNLFTCEPNRVSNASTSKAQKGYKLIILQAVTRAIMFTSAAAKTSAQLACTMQGQERL